MSKPTTSQFHANAAATGGVMGIITYLLFKVDFDPALTSMLLPVISGALSWASTKVGDPEVASFIGTSFNDGKPVKIAATKAAVKKAPAKKAAPKKDAK